MTEVAITPEMLAAGLEALHEARLECLSDGEMLIETFLAMTGQHFIHLTEDRYAPLH